MVDSVIPNSCSYFSDEEENDDEEEEDDDVTNEENAEDEDDDAESIESGGQDEPSSQREDSKEVDETEPLHSVSRLQAAVAFCPNTVFQIRNSIGAV